jgi:hypothetical protein
MNMNIVMYDVCILNKNVNILKIHIQFTVSYLW